MKPPKGYRITLTAMGNGSYALTIKKHGRLIYAPTQLRGWWDDCRKEAIEICHKNEANSPDAYVH